MRKKITLTLLIVFSVAVSFAQPPAGYYNSASGTTCADLKTKLKTIITNGFNQRTYNDLWGQYLLTDVKPREVGTGSASVIWDVYTDVPGPANDNFNFTPGKGPGGQQDQGSGGSSEGQFYNREHSFPQSWFGGGTTGPGADYIHIFPTDKFVNGKRGNLPYGEVSNPTLTTLNGTKVGPSGLAGFSGTVFEPIDSFKGDLARAFFYFVTRYEDNMSTYGNIALASQALDTTTFPSVDIPYLQMMINWHHLDPVSQKELTRNNGAYSFQGNRNPYIDHPEYVDYVWNNACPGLGVLLPVDVVYFGGKLSGEFVQLNWTVENEVLFDRYEIERSFNGTVFQIIGKVNAANVKKYAFTDNAIESRGRQVFYRIKKVDKDGKFAYSKVLSLKIPLNIKFNIYPNPATTCMQLQMNGNVSGEVVVQIADHTGKILLQHSCMTASGNIKISTATLASGTYFVKLLYNGEQYMQRVVVMK